MNHSFYSRLLLVASMFFMSQPQAEETGILGTTTIIKAVLTQKLVSDYVGDFRGYVSHDVYDVTQQYVLIPKGSKIHGEVVRIANVNEPISARVGYVIHSITRQDGVLIDFSNDSAVDNEGVSGIKDKVNRHILAQFLGVTAYAIISSESDGRNAGGLSGEIDVPGEVNEAMRDQFSSIAAKYLSLVPTITIRSGQTFNIFNVKPKKLNAYAGVLDEYLN